MRIIMIITNVLVIAFVVDDDDDDSDAGDANVYDVDITA